MAFLLVLLAFAACLSLSMMASAAATGKGDRCSSDADCKKVNCGPGLISYCFRGACDCIHIIAHALTREQATTVEANSSNN
ncbi:hypothetical protein CMV_012846 [Castanea mollissima]|uniref:Defensin n=1 Tax=Castanea mollissima TaxID=60419 RepID=A0A8J4VVL0_9ROSI|nr:hypothetical protein CMV_012846 [Castanea mollissima]